MKSTDIPIKFQIPFGNSAAAGTIRPVPVADQTASSPGAASLTTGFPVATGQPLASGGVPPAMQDFNGLFNQITAWIRWQNAGGLVAYDGTFANTIGGYPAGAVLSSTTPGLIWLNTTDSNTTNPDAASAAGWVSLTTAAAIAASNITGGNRLLYTSPGTVNWTVPSGVVRIRVRVWGAGGGGGGANGSNAGGSGGGGGGYTEGVFAVTPAQVVAYTVGAGGTPGVTNPTSTSQTGGTGGTSSVGSYCSATGGTGGAPGIGGLTNISGGGGSGSGGSVSETGTSGGLPFLIGSQVAVGQGGATPNGNGFGSLGIGGGGGTASFFGTGGNGAGGASAPGGTGGAGRIEVYY